MGISTYEAPALFGILPYYGMLVLLGGVLSGAWAYLEWNKKGYRTWDFFFLSSWMLLFAIYGAKIWYIIFDPVNALGGVNDILDFLVIFFVPAFGRSIIGTIVFVPIGIWLWQRIWGAEYNTFKIMDIIMPAFFLAQAIGRWGNFVNQEVYGNIVTGDSLNWLPSFIKNGMFIDGQYRAPLFLYESMVDLFGFVLMIIIFKTNNYWKDGVAGFTYIALYGLFRSLFELFRDPKFIMSWGHMPTNFVISLIMLLTGLSICIYLQIYKKNH